MILNTLYYAVNVLYKHLVHSETRISPLKQVPYNTFYGKCQFD